MMKEDGATRTCNDLMEEDVPVHVVVNDSGFAGPDNSTEENNNSPVKRQKTVGQSENNDDADDSNSIIQSGKRRFFSFLNVVNPLHRKAAVTHGTFATHNLE